VSIHPEGKRYAYNIAEDEISVVTEAHVIDPGVAEQLEHQYSYVFVFGTCKSPKPHCEATFIAASQCSGLLPPRKMSDVHLPATTELFLEIDQDTKTHSYWFPNHAHRFGSHPVDSDAVGQPDSSFQALSP
jgi:hypothetical protein